MKFIQRITYESVSREVYTLFLYLRIVPYHWFYRRIVVTVVPCSWSGRPAGRSARARTQHGYHHDTKVKPEAATAVIELLMMGGNTPETC